MASFKIILALFTLCAGSHAHVETDELKIALDKAIDFLADKENIKEIGSLFLKSKVSPELISVNDIPKDDAFAKLFGDEHAAKDLKLTRTIISDEILEHIPALRPLNNYFYILPKKYRNTVHDPWDDVLIKALYCDSTGFDPFDFAILSTLNDGRGGYFDTHKLMALLMLEENDCYDPKKIDAAKRAIVDNIVKALETTTVFSDLYAERVACLYWAGARDRVKPTWLRLIKNAQRNDGGFAELSFSNSNAHSTGLAAVSLKYFLDEKAAPIFYQRRSSPAKK